MALQAQRKRPADGLVLSATLANNSGADLSAGDLVQDDGAGGIAALADGGAFLGICHTAIANGETGAVELQALAVYKVMAAAGVDFALLDPIYPAGNGTFDAGSVGDVPAGWVVDGDPGAGEAFEAALVCEKFQMTAHA